MSVYTDAKPGDRFIVVGGWDESITTVERVTPTQIVTPIGRFRKSDGDRVGASSPWRRHLVAWDEARATMILAKRSRSEIARLAGNLPDKDAIDIYAHVRRAVEAKS